MMRHKQVADAHRSVRIGKGLASSICGQILSDLGASVIKIEPVGGDWLRGHEPQTNDSVSLPMRLDYSVPWPRVRRHGQSVPVRA